MKIRQKMLEKMLKTPAGEKIINQIKIQGILTSAIQLRGENTSEPYYYSFIKLKGQSVDLPVVFKIKDENSKLIKPNLRKNNEVELLGCYSNSPNSIRKSFTAYDSKLCFLTEQRENIFAK